MRLIIQLKAVKNFVYDLKYYHKLQGFIYSLLKDTAYSILHDIKTYKFFCFSNIFPVNEDYVINSGEKKFLIISSPDRIFLKIIENKLKEKQKNCEEIRIGEMCFEIENVKKLKVKINKNSVLISATPIIIRIPERNYDKYNIPEHMRKKRYVYWRPSIDFTAFIKQLEENLIKKYKTFYKEDFEIDRIFEYFRYKKPVAAHVVINGKEQIFIGSIWEFSFSYLTKEQRKILEFGIDCGFGERNSYGFGFVNLIKNKRVKI
ncbi:MAG TPA: CRISPR-associated endoribonuclease Cas6 [Nanoarchaeota archaeon]|nr:CRISPR-associated endoribonuclease Cas6 [Nanoarchaeota archaeon]